MCIYYALVKACLVICFETYRRLVFEKKEHGKKRQKDLQTKHPMDPEREREKGRERMHES